MFYRQCQRQFEAKLAPESQRCASGGLGNERRSMTKRRPSDLCCLRLPLWSMPISRNLSALGFEAWCWPPSLAVRGDDRPRWQNSPKRGGVLTYMIPADGGPSLDGHRETTYAVVHATAPFYSVLIRVNPSNPSSTTDFRCDLCTEMPKPTDNGLTYTFKIRKGVKFHDGSPLTAQDVAASWNKIVHPPKGVASARENNFVMVDTITAPDDETVVFKLKFATLTFLPALADPYAYIYSKKKLDQDMHWYEKNIMGSGPFKLTDYQVGQSIKGERNPDYYHLGPALPRRLRGDLRAQAVGAHRRHPGRPRRAGIPVAAAVGARPAGQGARRQDHRAGERLELRQRGDAQPPAASRSTTCACARPCSWPSTNGRARRRCRRSPSSRRWAASSSPARRWPRPRRSCSS